MSPLLTIAGIAFAQSLDPLLLPIGRSGVAEVEEGTIVELRSGRRAQVADIVRAAEGKRFVYLGESHDNPRHHRLQAEVVEALAESGRDVIVGFEMFTRPMQSALDPWTLGWWSEDEFVERSNWKGQWGFDFALYRPIFEATRKHRLRMVALNVPREWVRAVARGGPSALPEVAKSEVPELNLGNRDHRRVFDTLMGGHPAAGVQGENMYAAQVLWDTAMADSALRYLASRPTTSKTVMVVIAGSGHVMYGQGINYRVWQRTGESGVTLVMVGTPGVAKVSRGLADFAFNAPLSEGLAERKL